MEKRSLSTIEGEDYKTGVSSRKKERCTYVWPSGVNEFGNFFNTRKKRKKTRRERRCLGKFPLSIILTSLKLYLSS